MAADKGNTRIWTRKIAYRIFGFFFWILLRCKIRGKKKGIIEMISAFYLFPLERWTKCLVNAISQNEARILGSHAQKDLLSESPLKLDECQREVELTRYHEMWRGNSLEPGNRNDLYDNKMTKKNLRLSIITAQSNETSGAQDKLELFVSAAL
jgi:hypothetical protein